MQMKSGTCSRFQGCARLVVAFGLCALLNACGDDAETPRGDSGSAMDDGGGLDAGMDASQHLPDAQLDARFADNPYVVGEPNVRFYAGLPLATEEGLVVGTLCVFDRAPASP